MTKTLHRLTVKQIDAAISGSALADGGGLLYRSAGRAHGKWAFKFTSPDVDYRAAQAAKGAKSIQREMGLGVYPAVSLAAARVRCRKPATFHLRTPIDLRTDHDGYGRGKLRWWGRIGRHSTVRKWAEQCVRQAYG